VSLAIGFDVLSGSHFPAPRPGFSMLVPDVAWWLLETVLMLGLLWRGMKPRKAVGVWLAVVWLCASAARFTPLVLPLVTG
jgi:hypothetical protein